MTNNEFKKKLIELGILDLYLQSVQTCESGVDFTAGDDCDYCDYIFSDRIQSSFVWECAKCPQGKDPLKFWRDISRIEAHQI